MIGHLRDLTINQNILDIGLSPDDDSVFYVAVDGHLPTSNQQHITLEKKLALRVEMITLYCRDFIGNDYRLLHTNLAIKD